MDVLEPFVQVVFDKQEVPDGRVVNAHRVFPVHFFLLCCCPLAIAISRPTIFRDGINEDGKNFASGSGIEENKSIMECLSSPPRRTISSMISAITPLGVFLPSNMSILSLRRVKGGVRRALVRPLWYRQPLQGVWEKTAYFLYSVNSVSNSIRSSGDSGVSIL